jgi:hypothetical protein
MIKYMLALYGFIFPYIAMWIGGVEFKFSVSLMFAFIVSNFLLVQGYAFGSLIDKQREIEKDRYK